MDILVNVDLHRILLENCEQVLWKSSDREAFDQVVIRLYNFRRGVMSAEIEEDFERRAAAFIEELEAERFVPVQVARLAEWQTRRPVPSRG